MTLTDQLAELDVLEAKAMPGQWTAINEQTHLGPEKERTGAAWRLRSDDGTMIADSSGRNSYTLEFIAALRNIYPAIRAQLAAYQAELPEEPHRWVCAPNETSGMRTTTKDNSGAVYVWHKDYDSLRAAYAGLKVENERITVLAEAVRRDFNNTAEALAEAESTIAELRAKIEAQAKALRELLEHYIDETEEPVINARAALP